MRNYAESIQLHGANQTRWKASTLWSETWTYTHRRKCGFDGGGKDYVRL